jgi:hypothetical protein
MTSPQRRAVIFGSVAVSPANPATSSIQSSSLFLRLAIAQFVKSGPPNHGGGFRILDIAAVRKPSSFFLVTQARAAEYEFPMNKLAIILCSSTAWLF